MSNFPKILPAKFFFFFFLSHQDATVKNYPTKIYMTTKITTHFHSNTYLVNFKKDIQEMKACLLNLSLNLSEKHCVYDKSKCTIKKLKFFTFL